MNKEKELATQEHLEFLDTLRRSGVTNMYGAAPYIQKEFDIPENEAKKILSHWIRTFSDRLKKKEATL